MIIRKNIPLLPALCAAMAALGLTRPAVAASVHEAAPPAAHNVVFALAPGEDCADALQALIDANPQRAIHIPDGVYVLSHPVCTPASPSRAVALRLSDFAILRAAPDWAHTNAMVRLGGKNPANNAEHPCSVYGLYGGVVDGAGVADAISIESGRETRVQNVAIRNARVGIHVFWGANGGSADCDIRDIEMTGNSAPDSIGLLVEACDNTFSNFRIFKFRTGVRLRGAGNFLTNVHPLCWRDSGRAYPEETVGFYDTSANNCYSRCYSDQFSTAWLFGPRSNNAVLNGCCCYWYDSGIDVHHTALRCEGQFRALVDDFWAGFRDNCGTNAVLLVGEPGGHGVIRDIRLDESRLNSADERFREYFAGRIH